MVLKPAVYDNSIFYVNYKFQKLKYFLWLVGKEQPENKYCYSEEFWFTLHLWLE